MKDFYSLFVALEKIQDCEYPSLEESLYYSPSSMYPEYPWGNQISKQENHVYDAVRKCLLDLGLDKENYDTKLWNPLGKFISQGDYVVIKPNMVTHNHDYLDCVVTSPSIVRVIVDYVCIALKGEGKILIGDAPVQGGRFEDVAAKYIEIISFLYNIKSEKISIEMLDFREGNSFIDVDMGDFSFFVGKDKMYKSYRVTNYDYRKMKKYHYPHHHHYLIRKELLEANVIINIPKPKTHRKAGFTGALKNMVGTVVHKECLPHHIKGSVFLGGDEYLRPSIIKAVRTMITERLDLALLYNNRWKVPILRIGRKVSYKLMVLFCKEKYEEGSWWGNDTIWRTFGDINRILLYSDKNGVLHDVKCRHIFTVADMIIAGEKEGPLHPEPKKVGVVLAGDNAVAVDKVIANIMQLREEKLPAFRVIGDFKYNLYKKDNKTFIRSSRFDQIPYENMEILCEKFEPSDGWKAVMQDNTQ